MRISRKKKLVSEINVVPYIDVMLVLLVIFMVTAPMLVTGVSVDLPDANAEQISVDVVDEPLVISGQCIGTGCSKVVEYRLFANAGGDERKAITIDELKNLVSKIMIAKPDTKVQLKGDSRLNYQAVMEIAVALQDSGVESISFVAEPP